MSESKSRVLKIDQIRPYWRNPRNIPPEAVKAVRTSIEEYGYRQPIVVDEENVVVVGHTRLEALKDMGYKSAEVYITDLPEEKVKEYRLADNRTGELSSWDFDMLVTELRDTEATILEQFFPDVDLEIEAWESVAVTDEDMEKAASKVDPVGERKPVPTTVIECPACKDEFEVQTDALNSQV